MRRHDETAEAAGELVIGAVAARVLGEQENRVQCDFGVRGRRFNVPRGDGQPLLEICEVSLAEEVRKNAAASFEIHRRWSLSEVARSVKGTTSGELRRIFSQRRMWQRAQHGELVQRVIRSGHPSPSKSGQPFCTQSQMIGYYEPGKRSRVALVHQYLRPDGTIGASGRPDPKAIVDKGTLYVLKEKRP